MKNTILLSVFVAVASCGSLFGQSHSFEENANGIFPSAVDRSIVRHVTNDMVMGYIEQDTGRYIYCMQTNGEDVPLSFGLRAELPSTWTITDMRRYKEFMLVCGTVAGHPMYGRIPIGNGSIPGSLAVEWRTDTLLTDTLYRIAPIKYNPYVYNIIAIGRNIAITDRLGAVGFSQARTIPYTPNGEEFYDIVQDTNMYLYLLGTDIAKNALSMRRVAKAGLFSNFFCEYEMLYVPVDDAPIMINSGCCATTLPGGDIAVLHQSKTLSGMLRTDLVTIDSLSMDCKKRQVCMNQNKVSFRDVTYIWPTGSLPLLCKDSASQQTSIIDWKPLVEGEYGAKILYPDVNQSSLDVMRNEFFISVGSSTWLVQSTAPNSMTQSCVPHNGAPTYPRDAHDKYMTHEPLTPYYPAIIDNFYSKQYNPFFIQHTCIH